jgi:hypothetical protein
VTSISGAALASGTTGLRFAPPEDGGIDKAARTTLGRKGHFVARRAAPGRLDFANPSACTKGLAESFARRQHLPTRRLSAAFRNRRASVAVAPARRATEAVDPR